MASSSRTGRANAPSRLSYLTRAFTPAHADLPRSAGIPALLANEEYVAALARVVYYWAYPAVDQQGRHSVWEVMKAGAGLMFGLVPGGPKNTTAVMNTYLPPSQRLVVTPNNDTFYGVAFLDLSGEPVVVQTPVDVPAGHYWTIQIVDAFSNVIHQLGSASKTPGGKLLLGGPDWQGDKPDGFLDILRVPTNFAAAFSRSFAARTPEAALRAIAVLNQTGVYPFSQETGARHDFDCEGTTKNKVYPPEVTAEMLAADPDAIRPQWVNPRTFWTDLDTLLSANPTVDGYDAAMADQARALVELYRCDPSWTTLLDHIALEADAALKDSGHYHQVGVDAGNGWQRQENAGVWGCDWLGRALAAKVYIYVNDYHEALYLIRGTDSTGALFNGRHRYTVRFPKDGLPPVDRSRGGFWSLNMYDRDYFFLPDSPNGRSNVGTVSLDADELTFGRDGSLTLHLSAEPPEHADARANWLPAPNDQFALCMRTYVPSPALLDGSYALPDVVKG